MTEAVLIALITAAGGAITGVLGTRGYDKFVKNGRHGSHGIEHVISQRAAVEFQTRMTLLMERLTAAIEKGHDKALVQMDKVAASINDAAGAIRGVHEEIVQHRVETAPAVQASFETHRLVKEIHRLHTDPQERP